MAKELTSKRTQGHKYATTHGKTKTPEYICWYSMKARCYRKSHLSYPWYGGKGIIVCKRWLHSFENFLQDMGERPGKEYSIDRIDSNGNYEPSNCRWATKEQQIDNQYKNKSANIGDIFGVLEVVGKVKMNTEKDGRKVICKCTCGNTKEVFAIDLRSGKISSCGCISAQKST